MMPEQIVGDEYVVADRREVAAHGIDRPLAHGPRVELPDRAEGTSERAAAGGLDEPGGTMRQAGVLPPPRRHVVTRRQRHFVQCPCSRFAERPHDPAVPVWQRKAAHLRQRRAAIERVAHARQRAFAVVEHHCADLRDQKGLRVGRGGMPADDDRHVGRERPHTARERDDFVRLQRVHRGDTDEARPCDAHLRSERSAEAEIGQRHAMPARFERGGDVFHAERFDAEKRAETEPLVPWNGAKQQDVHV